MTCFRDRLIVGGVKKIKESGIAAPWGNKESGRVCLVADEQQVCLCGQTGTRESGGGRRSLSNMTRLRLASLPALTLAPREEMALIGYGSLPKASWALACECCLVTLVLIAARYVPRVE